MTELNRIDHIAIPVTDIASSVDWYLNHFQCEVKYQDATWALLGFANVQLALVIPEQHPAHLGFVTPEAEKFGALKTHRDGTRSCYVRDPAGNSIEMLAADSMPDYK
jgi:catechol 2,3-dioxygenase-like lactoylglutathione lyase family enzyme